MHLRTLHIRSLAHHWRAHTAVVLGVVAGNAALTGALLVGDALRGSLRAVALERLGDVTAVLQAPRFFRERLADDTAATPAILTRGSATHAPSRATAHRVNVLGIDERFWRLAPPGADPPPAPQGRNCAVNARLASELGAAVGDDILLRVRRPVPISPETLLGRRDETNLTLRLTVERIIPSEGLGAFSLNPQQLAPCNAFVPLATLQRSFDQPGRANTLLFSGSDTTDTQTVRQNLQQHASLDDFGLHVRADPQHRYVALESDAFLLTPAAETAGRAAAAELRLPPVALLAYLANSIEVESQSGAAVPYSTVVAIEPAGPLLERLITTAGQPVQSLAPGEILLNDWTAEDLGARVGDTIRLSYYLSGPLGQLETDEATFRLTGIVKLAHGAADPGLTPAYPGVTDSDAIADWDPPFPIDLRRIREQDETYWDQHRATPKAFVSLDDGVRLWATEQDRFGRLTALRVYPREPQSLPDVSTALDHALLDRIDFERLGLRVDDARARALAASRGTTDFAGLFIGFSMFVIVSAAMLVALLYRLNVERRAHEVGLLLATGFAPQRIARLLLAEGVALAIIGAAIGLPAARGYAWLMLVGLRTWWSAAVNAPFLRLHDAPTSYAIGSACSILLASVSIGWALRGMTRLPTRALLAGVTQLSRFASGHGSPARVVGLILGAVAIGLVVASLVSDAIAPTAAFFGGGAALLCACLAGFTAWLQSGRPHAARLSGVTGILRIGVRNARRHVGRSLLTASLIAAAAFVITALQAMQLVPERDVQARDSGTGGFALLAEADVPLPYDLNTAAGRAALNLPEDAQAQLANAHFASCRLRDGDETSCLNLYLPMQPRIIGASNTLIERGGFRFGGTLANTESERANPWTLLRREPADGSIAMIADEAAALWQLHLNLGDTVTITDETGREARLQLVGMLTGSVLQGELIVAETAFKRLFPSIAGRAFFLVDTAAEHASAVEAALERALSQYGFAVRSTRERLAELQAVQNTYLSTFQTLGGLGLLLGTFGLVAVLLRNVWERRGELALMRTLGFSRLALGSIVLIENAFLVAIGLTCGLVAAAVVVAPHILTRAPPIPWTSLLTMFLAILIVGLLAGGAVLRPVLRAPLLPALRSE